MSYLKQIVIKNLTITSVEGDKLATLGENITTILSIDYHENIFHPNYRFEIVFQSVENPFSDLKLRGTEKASIEIQHGSMEESFEFDDLILTAFVQNQTESTANQYTIRLEPEGIINNEKNRVTKRYSPDVAGSVHIENILKTQIGASEDEIDVEQSVNPVGFYGNYWRPFKALYWIARRSMSASMPEDGGGTDRVGFLFWQTKSGYKFKSIDTMISESKKGSVFKYVQNDALSDNSNFDIYNPTFEVDQNIIAQMMNSMYGENRKYFNLHTLQVTDDVAFSKTNAKQAHLGTEDEVKLDFDINEKPTVPTRNVFMDYTMRKDGTYDDDSKEYNPHKIISQARMRYQSLRSKALKITVPMNLQLEAGDILDIKIIKSMEGTDKWMSGLYIIKDLKHSYITRNNGVQCYTYLRLIKDTPGDD